MPKITFITHDGTEHVVEATCGCSVMEAAVDSNVPGVDADCGGCCSCATCHVVVEADWQATTGSPGDMEEDMLSIHDDRKGGSRLSCQMEVTDDMDGLVVRVPEFQM